MNGSYIGKRALIQSQKELPSHPVLKSIIPNCTMGLDCIAFPLPYSECENIVFEERICNAHRVPFKYVQ